jgi:16S rRNA processing protein RimM
MALVGRIARPHGIRGQVVVNPETDFPHERFQIGARLFVKTPAEDTDVACLVISTVRFHNERPIVGFDGVEDMDRARALAGHELRVPVEQLAALPPSMFYRHDLMGCTVDRVGGDHVGTVTDVEGTLGGSRLVVATGYGEVLVPLAAEICRSIDIDGKRIVIEPPDGLLDVNRKSRSADADRG